MNLRALEKEDIEFLADCFNNLDFWGENPFWEQVSKSERMRDFDNPPDRAVLVEWTRFIIQKKDGTKIGVAWHMTNQPYRAMEVSGFSVPSERGKGYGTEVVQLLVDYLFLSKRHLSDTGNDECEEQGVSENFGEGGLQNRGNYAEVSVREGSVD